MRNVFFKPPQRLGDVHVITKIASIAPNYQLDIVPAEDARQFNLDTSKPYAVRRDRWGHIGVVQDDVTHTGTASTALAIANHLPSSSEADPTDL